MKTAKKKIAALTMALSLLGAVAIPIGTSGHFGYAVKRYTESNVAGVVAGGAAGGAAGVAMEAIGAEAGAEIGGETGALVGGPVGAAIGVLAGGL